MLCVRSDITTSWCGYDICCNVDLDGYRNQKNAGTVHDVRAIGSIQQKRVCSHMWTLCMGILRRSAASCLITRVHSMALT